MPVTRLSAGQTIIPRHSTHCKRVVRPCIVSFNRRRRRRVRALFYAIKDQWKLFKCAFAEEKTSSARKILSSRFQLK